MAFASINKRNLITAKRPSVKRSSDGDGDGDGNCKGSELIAEETLHLIIY